MELVANIWPIVDEASQCIQRYAARPYCMDASDEAVSTTLRALATTDYLMAKQYAVPEQYELVTQHGSLSGTVTLPGFNTHQFVIIEPALVDMETNWPLFHGIGADAGGAMHTQHVRVKFPGEPYVVVTFLSEDANGNLTVVHARA